LILIKKQRKEKATLKPITSQIYELLIKFIIGKSYQAARFKIKGLLLLVLQLIIKNENLF